MWTEDTGTWSISSGKVSPSSVSSNEALLPADPELHVTAYSLDVTFSAMPASTDRGGVVIGHDGDDTYWAVVLENPIPNHRLSPRTSAMRLSLQSPPGRSSGPTIAGRWVAPVICSPSLCRRDALRRA